MVSESHIKQGRFWGEFEVPFDTASKWRIGPLELVVQRLTNEWRLVRSIVGDAHDQSLAFASGLDLDLPEGEVQRFGVSSSGTRLSLTPMLPERSVVSVPEMPFSVPAGEEIVVFVGSPLWLAIRAGQATLNEGPVLQPYDTWLGPNTQVGELCYAARTSCRLNLEELPQRPHRATTAVRVANRSTENLLLERIKLPAPYLSLWADDGSGDLWTNDVVFTYQGGADMAPMSIRKGAPEKKPRAQKISDPRIPTSGGLVVRAFGSLFLDRFGGAGA